jgi:two-component system, chemotaxis family, CheB/CheR fusion protein
VDKKLATQAQPTAQAQSVPTEPTQSEPTAQAQSVPTEPTVVDVITTGASKRIASKDPLPVVVAIGASAGGLEAFSKLLAALPLDSGMAFVLVQHLDPTHESLLTELLGRTTGLKVTEIVDGLSVEANQVFVIPQNANLTIKHGVLRLTAPTADRGPPSSIDAFMASLAQDLGHRAIGVVLSGTISDGTLGLEAIKVAGGITFAQDPKTARFDSMPSSAIAAGVVDFVLAPEQIASELARLAKQPYLRQVVSAKSKAGLDLVQADQVNYEAADHQAADHQAADHQADHEAADHQADHEAADHQADHEAADHEAADHQADPKALERILTLLRDGRGVDFSLYRSTTVGRRIDRRMLLAGAASMQQYAERLQTQPAELEALYQDLLIGVTSFFRDPHVFEYLQREIFGGLVTDRTPDKPLRMWVGGCSSGQEAYSLAIAFLEFTAKAGLDVPLQIFATDLNEAALEKARAGLYPSALLHAVSKERLKRFFTEQPDGSYRIGSLVRKLVVFARQNVFSDPPFSRLDLISCRNLLIYLDPLLQARVIPTFHHALKVGGVLLLGASETVGRFSNLFVPLDNRSRLYRKLDATNRIASIGALSGLPTAKPRAEPPTVGASDPDSQREADQLLLARYAPAGVMVDDSLEVIHFRGSTGRFLEPATGKASFNLLRLARDGLMVPLRNLIERARQEQQAVREEALGFLHDGRSMTVNLEVVPLKRPGCLLVLFELAAQPASQPASQPSQPQATPTKAQAAESSRVATLSRELLEEREYLRLVQEQHEDASDRLQAINEELQSSSEEFQSVNEELETAKEELESSNEEMQTLNDELMGRNSELAQVNSDLVNFQVSAKLSLISVGPDLKVRRFTSQAETNLRLRAADIGQPVGHLRHQFNSTDLPDLEALIATVIESGTPLEREVRDRSGLWFLLRIRPYLTTEHQIDGATLVLFGIEKLKQAQFERQRLQQETEAIFESIKDGLIAINHDWIITFINSTGVIMSGKQRAEMIGQLYWQVFPETVGTRFSISYRKAMSERVMVEFEEYYQPLERQYAIRVVPVAAGITIFWRDMTARHRAELLVEAAQTQLRAFAESQRRFLADAAHELRTPLAVIQGNMEVLERFPNMLATERNEAIGDSAREAARLGRLVNDLLSLARGDAGDHLHLEPLELLPIVEETLREAQKLAVGRQLTANQLKPCRILGNRDKLKQLTLILLDNALKYAPDGGRVTLELRHQGSHAELRIVNTGPTISPQDLEHIFERFYRTDASRSRQTGGTGLGLPIARWIAEQHGGTVELESEAGVGTTGIVRLPLLQAAETVGFNQ